MINELYEGISNPICIRPLIKDFNGWLEIDMEGSLYEDLQGALKAFEKAEMYEDCIIIKEKINNYGR